MIKNQDLDAIIADRSTTHAFHVLSHIKKLCLHPFLLTDSNVQKRNNMGLVSPEEASILRIQYEAEQAEIQKQLVKGMRTRKQKEEKQI
jgi:hypothetical protein